MGKLGLTEALLFLALLFLIFAERIFGFLVRRIFPAETAAANAPAADPRPASERASTETATPTPTKTEEPSQPSPAGEDAEAKRPASPAPPPAAPRDESLETESQP